MREQPLPHGGGGEGRTLWERGAGWTSGTVVADFGERDMCVARGPNRERQWSFGVRMSLVTRTQESYVGISDGVVQA